MNKGDEREAFVLFQGEKEFFQKDKFGVVWPVIKHQWILNFENVQPIEPFKFIDENGKSLGKQGVGRLENKYHQLIKL